MRSFGGTRRLLCATVASVVAVLAVGSYAFGSHGVVATGRRLARTPAGPERLVRADELGPVKTIQVFSLANRERVEVLKGRRGRCLVRLRYGRSTGQTCLPVAVPQHATVAQAHGNQGIIVTDECGSGGENRMEITGLAPEGTTSVRLDESNGTSSTTQVVGGAFRFNGRNPSPSGPYPTGLEWLEAHIGDGAGELPVVGDQFCLPTE